MAHVILYSRTGWGACKQAKEFLRQEGIGYEEKDIGADDAAKGELAERGIQSTPVLVIDGETVVGYDPDRIRELLDAA